MSSETSTEPEFTDEEREMVEKLKDGVGRSLCTSFLAHFDTYDFVRFLRARPGDLAASVKMLKQHIEWNNTHLTDYGRPGRLYLTDDAVSNELETGKAFIHKTDKQGRPCTYVFAERHDTRRDDREEVKRFVVYMLDKLEGVIRTQKGTTNRERQFVVIFDFDNFGRRNYDVGALKHILKILGDNYPERLGALWFVNVGWLFWVLWKVINPFIPSKTRSKIHMLGKDHPRVLLEHFDPENLLVKFGGTDTYEYSFGGHRAFGHADFPTESTPTPSRREEAEREAAAIAAEEEAGKATGTEAEAEAKESS